MCTIFFWFVRHETERKFKIKLTNCYRIFCVIGSCDQSYVDVFETKLFSFKLNFKMAWWIVLLPFFGLIVFPLMLGCSANVLIAIRKRRKMRHLEEQTGTATCGEWAVMIIFIRYDTVVLHMMVSLWKQSKQ